VQVVPPEATGLTIPMRLPGREHPLPPRRRGSRVFGTQTTGHIHHPPPVCQVLVIQHPHPTKMRFQRSPQRIGDDGDPVLAALAPPNGQLTAVEIEVLDPKRHALDQAEATPIQKKADQPRDPNTAAHTRQSSLLRAAASVRSHCQATPHPPQKESCHRSETGDSRM
jgi:hypothetical protein